jgi:hypothetical protein
VFLCYKITLFASVNIWTLSANARIMPEQILKRIARETSTGFKIRYQAIIDKNTPLNNNSKHSIVLTTPQCLTTMWRAAYAPADRQPVGVYFTPTDRQHSWGCTPPPLYSPCI